MSRPSLVHTPRKDTVKRLRTFLRSPDLAPLQRRRIETILLHGQGMSAVDIASALGVHPQTIYSDLYLYETSGLANTLRMRKRGAKPRIRVAQHEIIYRLADLPPYQLGLPYGRWSLSRLKAYLIKHQIVKTISHEHLRRILKKRGSGSSELFASSQVKIPIDLQF